jgi:hypothetical protein
MKRALPSRLAGVDLSIAVGEIAQHHFVGQRLRRRMPEADGRGRLHSLAHVGKQRVRAAVAAPRPGIRSEAVGVKLLENGFRQNGSAGFPWKAGGIKASLSGPPQNTVPPSPVFFSTVATLQ